MRFDFFVKEILMKSTFVSAKQMFLVAMVAARVVLRSFFFCSMRSRNGYAAQIIFCVSPNQGVLTISKNLQERKTEFFVLTAMISIHFFFCVETLLKVSEMQGRNDLYQHKMMMTGKWDDEVWQNLDC